MQDNLRASRVPPGSALGRKSLRRSPVPPVGEYRVAVPSLKDHSCSRSFSPQPRPFGSQSSTLCPSQISQICHYVFVYVTQSFSSVGEEDSGNIERYAEVDRPPIGAVKRMNTAVVHFHRNRISVAVVRLPRPEIPTSPHVVVDTAHECRSIQRHVHVQSAAYCVNRTHVAPANRH